MSRLMMLIALLLLAGCSRVLPSSAQYPSPLPSAAQPAVTGKGDLVYAKRGADEIRKYLRDFSPEEALAQIPEEGIEIDDPEVSAGCASAPGKLPVLLCHFGPSSSQPVAQVLLWYERESWRSQLYPQVAPKLAEERRAALEELGCQIGCYSGIIQARQEQGPDGPELLAVINLGFTGAQPAEEVQLLRLEDGLWEVAWAPGGGDWNYGHAQVTLSPQGLTNFQVRNSSWIRQDRLAGYLNEPETGEHRRFEERWVRKGSGYMMRDQVEEETPYSALNKVIFYLTTGADEKVQALLSDAVPLETARKALAQKPARQGWNVTRWGQNGFLLDTGQHGKPNLGVRFERGADGWRLAEIWNPSR